MFISVGFARHAPRIKVAIDPPTDVDPLPLGNNASVAVQDGRVVSGHLSGRPLEQVQRFIEANRAPTLTNCASG